MPPDYANFHGNFKLHSLQLLHQYITIFCLFNSYEARRVILKQGHPPSGFYIMLSGVAIVNARDVNPETNTSFIRTVGQLVAGDTFGVNYY